jgi:hypothetical protein
VSPFAETAEKSDMLKGMLKRLMIAMGYAVCVGVVLSCSAAKEELKTTPGTEANAPHPRRIAQADQFEKELRDWDAKAVPLKSVTVKDASDRRFKIHAKAIDDIEGQMKAARAHIRDLREARNEKEETDARNKVIDNLSTIEKINRQLEAE